MEPGFYRGMNIQFRYPENWTLSEETEHGQVNAVNVESPDHAFFVVTRYRNSNKPDAILEEAVEAMLSGVRYAGRRGRDDRRSRSRLSNSGRPLLFPRSFGRLPVRGDTGQQRSASVPVPS
jgi:hypothetical protein